MENLSESKGLGQLQKFTDSEMHVKFWVAQISFQVALRNSWKKTRVLDTPTDPKRVSGFHHCSWPILFHEGERVEQNHFVFTRHSCPSPSFPYQMHEVEMCKTKSSPKSQGCKKFLCHTNLWECNFWGVGRFGLRRLTYVRDFPKILVMDMAHQSSIRVQWSSLFKGSLRSSVLPTEIAMTITYSNPDFFQSSFCSEKNACCTIKSKSHCGAGAWHPCEPHWCCSIAARVCMAWTCPIWSDSLWDLVAATHPHYCCDIDLVYIDGPLHFFLWPVAVPASTSISTFYRQYRVNSSTSVRKRVKRRRWTKPNRTSGVLLRACAEFIGMLLGS